MTPTQLRALMNKLGLTRRELAKRWKYTERQVGRFLKGDVPIPPPCPHCGKYPFEGPAPARDNPP
jgi:hypothetical protein